MSSVIETINRPRPKAIYAAALEIWHFTHK